MNTPDPILGKYVPLNCRQTEPSEVGVVSESTTVYANINCSRE